MSKKIKDLTGLTFGRLTVIEINGRNSRGGVMWLCKCQCGNEKTCSSGNLNHGHTKSCGCLQKEKAAQTGKDYSDAVKKHGLSANPLYKRWKDMIDRCECLTHQNYYRYGGRGIKVCPEWSNKETGLLVFIKWANENGYEKGLWFDRENNDGNYEPSNCRWVTPLVSGNNTRFNRFLEFNGERKTIAQWAKYLGFPLPVINKRLSKKWSIERALTTPVQTDKSHRRESII